MGSLLGFMNFFTSLSPTPIIARRATSSTMGTSWSAYWLSQASLHVTAHRHSPCRLLQSMRYAVTRLEPWHRGTAKSLPA
jgi:hypothetical protein